MPFSLTRPILTTLLVAASLLGAAPSRAADFDLVEFDPQQIIDRAAFAGPALPSHAMQHALVNGVFVVRDGQVQQGNYPGQPVRRGYNDRSQKEAP
jgi:N-acyl-D-aspartate/D-glutamate deacylase